MSCCVSDWEGTPNVVLEAHCGACPWRPTPAARAKHCCPTGPAFWSGLMTWKEPCARLPSCFTTKRRHALAQAGERFVRERSRLSALPEHVELYETTLGHAPAPSLAHA